MIDLGRATRFAILGLLGAVAMAALAPVSVRALTVFEDVSAQAGIDHVGVSKGVSWGDFNGDGWPDLWACNHNFQPSLWLNNGDGTFTDIILQVWSDSPGLDTHGAAWGDADNDGDQDLLELVGAAFGEGSHPNRAYINQGGVFVESAAALGLEYPDASGYTPLWFDGNGDSRLDAILCNRRRYITNPPNTVFLNEGSSFRDVGAQIGFLPENGSNFAMLSDVSGDGRLDLMLPGYPFPSVIFDITKPVLTDITDQVPGLPVDIRWQITAAAVADLNGDMIPDFFLTGDKGGSDVYQVSDQELAFTLRIYSGPMGFDFTASGPVSFALYPHPWLSRQHIFIGAGGVHPDDLNFTLDPDSTWTWGIAPADTSQPEAIFVGYDPDLGQWTLGTPLPDAETWNGRVTSTSPVAVVATRGFRQFAPYSQDYVVLSGDGGYVTTLLPKLTACGSVVAGDFDNDMDLDIYLVSTGPVANLPNILYRNQGDGTFLEVTNAGGASGSKRGEGESVALADYDRDGFLELWVTNGDEYGDFGSGPDQLFRNLAGTRQNPPNHWLEVDLVGTVSNRDGIGARLFAYAGGVGQLREQNGGMHKYCQNHTRLHFGLAQNAVVDSLVVNWPSGFVSRLYDVSVDQILSVTEPAGKSLADAGQAEKTAKPAGPELAEAFPNPFNPSTTIAFELGEPGSIDLSVFDLAGRRVARLASGPYPAGAHQLVWRGRDAAGRQVPAGTYYYRLSVGNETRVGKMILVK